MNSKWVSIWGNTMSCDEYRPASYAKNITLRYIITPLLNGSKIKLHFANTYGYETVTLNKVSVSRVVTGSECTEFKGVKFDSADSVKIGVGEYVCSDELPFEVKRGEKIAVSIYLKDITDMRSSISTSGPLSENYFSEGDCTFSDVLPLELTETNTRYYFMDGVEVLASENDKCAVFFGDSITAQSWPEWLALRLLDNSVENISVVRKAISGSRVLRQYDNLALKKYGQTGVDRFECDISVSGADRVFVLHGINDIIHPDGIRAFRPLSDLPTSDELIDGYRKYIEIAHSKGMKIYLAEILPFKGWRTYAEDKNAIREKVNEWIRNNTEADGYIDFASAVAMKEDKDALVPEYDSGDHLHPSIEGAKTMANHLPLNLIR